MDARSGEALVDFTRVAGRQHRGSRVHQRAELARDGGAPEGYDAAAYGHDFKLFHAFAKQAAPDMLIWGRAQSAIRGGLVRHGGGIAAMLNSRDLLAAIQPAESTPSPTTITGGLEALRPLGPPDDAGGCAHGTAGSGAPTRPSAFTASCATSSSPAGRSGTPRPPMRPAAATRGRLAFLDTFRYLDNSPADGGAYTNPR